MMRPRWRKVLADLWSNKARTLLVIVSIAVGVLAIGVIAGTFAMLSTDLNASYAASNPANITLTTLPFDPGFVDVIRRVEGVAEAEGRRTVTVRVHTGGNAWETLRLTAIPDFETARIHRLFPRGGTPVPGDRQVVLEHKTLAALETMVGEALLIELEDGTRRDLPVVGAALDQTRLEQLILGEYRGFITYDTLSGCMRRRASTSSTSIVTDEPNNAAHILPVAAAVTSRLERTVDDTGTPRTALHLQMAPQNRHPLKGILDALLLVLIIIGGLVLFLSGSLIFNTMSALLSQHLRQIGVMKLVGARRRQVIGMYLLLITTFGLAALVGSVPLGAVGAYQLTRFVASMVNFEMAPFRLIPEVLVFQILVGLLVPPIAGLLPVLRGSRIRIREALSSSGLTDGAAAPAHQDKRPARWRLGRRTILCAAQYVQAQGPSGADASDADAGRRGVHCGLQHPSLAQRDHGPDGALFWSRRERGVRAPLPYQPGDARDPARARCHRGRGVDGGVGGARAYGWGTGRVGLDYRAAGREPVGGAADACRSLVAARG
jgi:putative ABC transport system permease protein